jgi:hypothetical protein
LGAVRSAEARVRTTDHLPELFDQMMQSPRAAAGDAGHATTILPKRSLERTRRALRDRCSVVKASRGLPGTTAVKPQVACRLEHRRPVSAVRCEVADFHPLAGIHDQTRPRLECIVADAFERPSFAAAAATMFARLALPVLEPSDVPLCYSLGRQEQRGL